MPPPVTPGDESQDRRQHSRKNLVDCQLVSVELAPSDAGAESIKPPHGIIIDLSEGGLAVQPFRPVSPGGTTRIALELPGSHARFEGTATVAWVGPGGRAGIRFLELAEPARQELERALANEEAAAGFLAEITPPIQAARDAEALDLDTALQLIAERVRSITAAAGAAIAVGDSNGMICRATVGHAPGVGVPLLPGAGLTGVCLRSGEMVHCADAENDPRIDPELARQLNLRSVLVVPVYARGALRGLMELLSPRPQAFEPRHLTRMLRIAELLSLMLEEADGQGEAVAASGAEGITDAEGTETAECGGDPSVLSAPDSSSAERQPVRKPRKRFFGTP